jgi:hypothetical protein
LHYFSFLTHILSEKKTGTRKQERQEGVQWQITYFTYLTYSVSLLRSVVTRAGNCTPHLAAPELPRLAIPTSRELTAIVPSVNTGSLARGDPG